MKRILTNSEIWEICNLVESTFQSNDQLELPIKVNYALQLNRKTLKEKYKIIEELRMKIGKKYGESNETGYIIPKENLEQAQNEMNQLLEIEQAIDIMFISLKDLQDIKLSISQMQALLFMIEEE